MNDFVRIMNENGDCSTLFVNQIQTGFAFASKIDYLCRRESDNALSLFFMSCGKTQCNLRQITVQLDANYTIT